MEFLSGGMFSLDQLFSISFTIRIEHGLSKSSQQLSHCSLWAASISLFEANTVLV